MSHIKEEQIKNWAILSLIALLLSIQALLLTLKAIDSLHPMPIVVLGLGILFFTLGQIIIAVGGGKYWQGVFKRQDLKAFLMVEMVLTFFLLSAVDKMIFYDYRPEMARRAYDVLLVLSVLNVIGWPHIRQRGAQAYALINDHANAKLLRQLTIILGSVLVALIIFVPHFERVLARMYIGEQFHHFEMFVMAAGWAASCGHVLYVDQTSSYGMGMPYIFAELAHWMGGFSHEHVFLAIMIGVMVYYVLMFWFSLRFFKSAALTLAVMLWAIRVQMFHPGDYPFVLTYPSATVIRYFFDIFVMAAIYLHLQGGKSRWLFAAGALSGLSVFYMDSTGLFLLIAFYTYLFFLLIMPATRPMLYKSKQDAVVLIIYFFLPVAVALGLFYAIAGHHLFTGQFWHNYTEFIRYFIVSGMGEASVFDDFTYHNFWAGLVGLIIPAVWVFTIIIVGAMCYFKKLSRRHIFIMVVCVYGLGINHYYIARAVLTSYYVTALPFIFVCGYWLKLLLWSWPRRSRQNAILITLAVSFYALFTNHNFMAYPNIFNWSHNPMIDPLTAQPLPADLSTYFNHLYRNSSDDLKLPTNSLGSKDEELYTERSFASDDDLVAYYHQDFDFSHDAAMIRYLTKPGDRVAVISSFEIRILMQADRPPFFYYFPLLNSRSKHMRIMPLDSVNTNPETLDDKSIEQMEEAKPPYVFLEKIFLYNYPQAYVDNPENIIPIIDYVRRHYTPYGNGEYLVAMKRKDS